MKNDFDLYISVGNSQISFAIFGKTIDDIHVTKKNLKNIDLIKSINELNINVLKIFVCSVVPLITQQIKILLKNKEVTFLTSLNQKNIDLSNLNNTYEIGNDIIASSIFANKLGTNVTVVSLGTATVISNISNGKIIGCTISAGIKTSYDALINATSLKGTKTKLIKTTRNIGKNTNEAISIGTINGHELMIEGISKGFHTNNTIYTYYGGNSCYIHLKGWTKIDNMELLGLYLFSKSN